MERRRHPRYEIAAHVRITYGKRAYRMEVGNVSRGGAYVCSGDDVPPWIASGRPVELRLEASDAGLGAEITLSGRIVHVHEAPSGEPAGFGVRFDEPDERTAALLEQLLTWAAGDSTRPPSLPRRSRGE